MIMDWTRILAYITGTVDQELLLRNEYLAAENWILKAQLKKTLSLAWIPIHAAIGVWKSPLQCELHE